MPKSSDSTAVAKSAKLYERLLALYPREHRREYGRPMAQLFRDQCRDAWVEAGTWGLTVLWLRVSVDLAKTSMAEHLHNLKRRKCMFSKMLLAFRAHPTPRTTFLVLFAVVFLLVLGSSALVTFLLPACYASTARIKVEPNATGVAREQFKQAFVAGAYDPHLTQTELALIDSAAILGRVAKKLGLAESWGKTYANGERLTEAETIWLLKSCIDVRVFRRVGGADWLDAISVYGPNPKEASEIANALAESYRELAVVSAEESVLAEIDRPFALDSGKRNEQPRSTAGVGTPRSRTVYIVDNAVPGPRPVRPNKPLNLSLGILGGILLASVVGGVGALVANRRRSHPQSATT